MAASRILTSLQSSKLTSIVTILSFIEPEIRTVESAIRSKRVDV